MKDKNDLDYEEFEMSPLFEFIAKTIKALFNALAKFLIMLWRGFLLAFYNGVNLWKPLLVAGIIGAGASYGLNTLQKDTYKNELVLSPKFDVEQQLINDITHLQSLVQEQDHEQLAQLLEVTEEQAGSISAIRLDLKVNDIEKIKYFDNLVGTIDTSVLKAFNLKELVNKESIEPVYSRYSITVSSTDPNIFSPLESSIKKLVNRNKSVVSLRKAWRESILARKERMLANMSELDSLKEAAEGALTHQAQSQSNSTNLITGGQFRGGNEYLLGLEWVYYRDEYYNIELDKINVALASEGDALKIITHFTPTGNKNSGSTLKAIILGFLAGCGLLFLFRLFRWFYIKGSEL